MCTKNFSNNGKNDLFSANPVNQQEPQPGPSNRQRQPEQSGASANPASADDTSSNSDDDQNHGFLLLPADASTGTPSRIFSFVTQRSQRRRRLPTGTRSSNKDGSESSLENARIHQNVNRLTHYVQESNSDQVSWKKKIKIDFTYK